MNKGAYSPILARSLSIDFEISKINHHPEWKNIYNRIEVVLTTHDAGNRVTSLDRKLAEIMDAVFEGMKSQN